MPNQDSTAAKPQPLDLLKKYRLDLHAVESGKWVEIRGDKWLVAKYRCAAWSKERAAALAELGLTADAEPPAHKVAFVEEWIFAKAIVRGCKIDGSTDDVYTTEMGKHIWSDPEMRELRDQLFAASVGDYTQDAIAKNAVLGN